MGWPDMTELQETKYTTQWKEKTINNVQLEGEIVWQGFVEVCGILFILTGYHMLLEGRLGCYISL